MKKVIVYKAEYGEATLSDLIQVLQASEVEKDFDVFTRSPNAAQFEKDCKGICDPHSYRGYYERLAFTPGGVDGTVESTLDMVRRCIGNVYKGYKGGEYTMNGDTILAIAHRGYSGNPIGSIEIDVQARTVTLVEVKEVY